MSRRSQQQQGSAFVELTLLMTVLLPILAGAIQLSSAVTNGMHLVEAARIMTRKSFRQSLQAADSYQLCSDIGTAATSSIQAAGFKLNEVEVTVAPLPIDDGAWSEQPLTPVQVQFSFDSYPWAALGYTAVFSTYLLVPSATAAELTECEVDMGDAEVMDASPQEVL